MTCDILDKFLIKIEREDYRHFYIKGNQIYKPQDLAVEADYSQAAFYFAANAIGNCIDIQGLNKGSLQGDREIVNIISILQNAGSIEIDVNDVPDLVPALAVAAALREGGTTRLTGAARLRLKESDRLDSVTSELGKLGAVIEQSEDSLVIHGVGKLTGGETVSHGDHRIVMAIAVAATRADGEVVISGAENVKKSYPDFWDKYRSLGGNFRCSI
jgi:3-phosphoshikimate 1-carboxyvinyltransferase